MTTMRRIAATLALAGLLSLPTAGSAFAATAIEYGLI
jgi:hypothetical protein